MTTNFKENLNPVDEAILTAIALLLPEHVSEWREIHRLEDGTALAIDWRTLPQWSPEARECVAVALHDYAIAGSDPSDVLHEVTMSDQRVGVYLACAVARTALHHVPAGDDRPLHAIECAERWVRGEATKTECWAAADAAAAYAATASDAARSAAYSAYYSVYAAANAAFEAVYAASNAARAAYYAAANSAYYDAAQRELCEVVASAVRAALDAL